jgi:predicted nuclease of restriction endonuclease-like (RecB) superfamily
MTTNKPTKPKAIVQEPLAQFSDLPDGYASFLADLKKQIQGAQVRAAVSVNRELVLLYWNIGKQILKQQQAQGWGTKVIERLSVDLRHAFPDMKGFSSRNLKYMRALADAFPDHSIVQQLAAQLPWFHLCKIIDRVKYPAERAWYISQTIENGWSRNVMVHQIDSGLYHRQGKTETNFLRTLPEPQSELAQQILKDPYSFDFLNLTKEIAERDLHKKLLEHLREFLLELGVGFSFVGSEYHLEVGGSDFYLDLLFYHLKLRCFVVLELKVGEFKPEYAGKMNFYLSTVDDLLRHKDDHPSIGLIICRDKNKAIVEYSLRDNSKPMGVAAYRLTSALPKQLESILPSIADLERELREIK